MSPEKTRLLVNESKETKLKSIFEETKIKMTPRTNILEKLTPLWHSYVKRRDHGNGDYTRQRGTHPTLRVQYRSSKQFRRAYVRHPRK